MNVVDRKYRITLVKQQRCRWQLRLDHLEYLKAIQSVAEVLYGEIAADGVKRKEKKKKQKKKKTFNPT